MVCRRLYLRFLILLCSLILSGCGLAKRISSPFTEFTIETHRNFCGPEAIQKVLRSYGKETDTGIISANIIKHQSIEAFLIREFGGMFLSDITGVTLPSEIHGYFIRAGFNVSVVTGDDRHLRAILKEYEARKYYGIILTQHKIETYYMHYEAFTSDRKRSSLYGDDTRFLCIFLISKETSSKLANN